MNKQEFLATLKAELSFLPLDERVNAVKYYEEYFDDAGEENETAILLELGTPKQVAEKILEDLGYQKNGIFKNPTGNIELKIIDSVESLENDNVFNKDYGFNIEKEAKETKEAEENKASKGANINYAASVSQENIKEEPKEPIEHEHKREDNFVKIKQERESKEYTNKNSENNNFGRKSPNTLPKNNSTTVLLTVVLLIFGAPIWIPLLSAVFITIASIFVALFSVAVTFLGVAITGAAVAVMGIGLIFYGAAALFTSIFVAVSTVGVGFLCLGIGIILGFAFFKAGIVLFKVMFKVTAKMINGIVGAIRGIFGRKNYNAA